jgi:putative oxidoreductase
VGITEFFGGLCLVLGFLTRPAAAAATILLTVAAVKVHLPNGFFWSNGGWEYPVLWALMALAVFFRGGGEFSLDARIGREF